uniref:Fatty acyl-CoA reductase n=1 Tax=Oryza glumipatula TaxID=40148 RepID=A0A0D9ZJE6_9ORYZ
MFMVAVLVEKILRVQPEVRKLYLLVRAPDAAAAEERVLTEFIEKCSEPFRQPYEAFVLWFQRCRFHSWYQLLVEKILRVQPEVRKLYLLVRAPDAIAAEERVLTEVVGNGLFDVLREQYGAGFHSFIKEKIYALPGDVTHENFGLESYDILQLSQKVDIIVNGAATTNFMERYDVALATNTTGVVHLCQFAKQCDNLKMMLHVSTAYVAGEQAGQIFEKPFQMGTALRLDYQLDIEAELQLVDKIKSELGINSDSKLEKITMRKLGLERF